MVDQFFKHLHLPLPGPGIKKFEIPLYQSLIAAALIILHVSLLARAVRNFLREDQQFALVEWAAGIAITIGVPLVAAMLMTRLTSNQAAARKVFCLGALVLVLIWVAVALS